MKIYSRLFIVLLAIIPLFSCKTMLMNKVGDALAGADKNGVPAAKKSDSPDPMLAFMGESDPVIVREVLPMIVKMYEILAIENPDHQGTLIMAGQLNIMYGNFCVQSPADELPLDMVEKQFAEYDRARLHYKKGRGYILDAFEKRWPGFKNDILSSDAEVAKAAAQKITKADVNAAYWAAGASLLNWASNPLDIESISSIAGPVALLERAAELDPDYSDGAIWDALAQFYAAAPADFGGDMERAEFCYKEALRASGGKSAGVYITYAQSFCVPKEDRAGFVEALEKALAIEPSESGRLMNILSQQKARRLLNNVDDIFFEW